MHIFWFIFVGLLIISAVQADAVQIVNVPASAKQIQMDGIYEEHKWSDAALLQNINILGTAGISPQKTIVHLKSDLSFLYVGVQCYENSPGYPTAFKRKPIDYLGDDDAVQVVLGIADESLPRDVLMMGGYEGAMNTEVASADHYYQFTVNAAGASSRTYNEGVLARPLFESKVSNYDRFWYVEMKIPFASAGIDPEKNKKIFFNFYRFRPPEILGWNSRPFGNYTPMPFGIMKLTKTEDRTLESILPSAESKAADNKSKSSVSIDYYPLSRKVIAVVEGYNEFDSKAQLVVDGLGKKSVEIVEESTKIVLDIPDVFDSQIRASIIITDSDNNVLLRETKILQNTSDKPPWYGTEVAKDYLTSKIPSPWTKPKLSGYTVKLSNKTLVFGSNGLFKSIIFTDGDFLAGNSKIDLEIDNKKVRWTESKYFSKIKDNKATVQVVNSFEGGYIEVRSVVDYDGFTVVKLRVNGVKQSSISSLSLEFPINPERARFIYRDTAQTVRELTGFGWQGKAGPVWVGGYEKGLSFDYDTPVFLSENKRSQIQVIEEQGKAWLKLNLVDAKGQVKQASHIFRFILQPTPTRNPSLDKTGIYHKTALWFEEWSDYQGYPDLSKMEQVKERSKRAHEKGLLQMLYFNQSLASNAPGFQEFRNELVAPPDRGWYKRAYNPGKDVVCYVSCVRGAFGDLLLDGIKKLSDQGDIDGVYMDGTSVPWDCENPAHEYCAGAPEIGWDDEDYTPYIGTRNFLKRLRGIFDAKGKPCFLMTHTGGAINIATMSLCDGHYEGEQLSRYRRGYRLPLSIFASGYSGRSWGFRTDLLPMRPIYSCEEMRTWGLLHDGAVGDGPYGEPGGARLEERIYGDFQDDALTKYYPYWREQPHIKMNNPEILCSYYLKLDAAMLVFGNLSWENQNINVDISNIFPGKTVYVTDVVDQKSVQITSNILSIDLKMHRYAAFRVDTSPGYPVVAATDEVVTLAPIIFEDTAISSTDWSLAEKRSGVELYTSHVIADKSDGLKLTSTLYADEANIKLEEFPIGRNGHIKLRLQHSGILRIKVGESGVFYASGTWTPFNISPWNRGTLYQPVPAFDRSVEIVLSITDGVMDATYDGKPLSRGLELTNLENSSAVSLATWSNDWLVVEWGEISKKPVELFEELIEHPVL